MRSGTPKMAKMPSFRVEEVADAGIVISFKDSPSRKLTHSIVGIARRCLDLHGVIDAIPGQHTLLLEVETARIEEVRAAIGELVRTSDPILGKDHHLVIRYDGPDIEWVCDHLGISVEELITTHTSQDYDVRMLGSPGFIYLSEVPDPIALPRMEVPRLSVPAGSVGIGGRQTGIYGRARPGGWRLIGSVDQIPGVHPGDRVRLIPA